MFQPLTTTEARELSDTLIRAGSKLDGAARALLHTRQFVQAAREMAAMGEVTELVIDLTHFRAQRAARATPVKLEIR